MSESGMQVVCEEIEKKGSLYVFPGPAPISISPRVPPLNQSSPIATTITTSGLSWYKGGLGEAVGVEDEEDTEFGKRRKRPQSVKGHKRSVSHGGVLATSSTGWQTTIGPQTNSSMTGVPISTMTTSTTTTRSAITTATTTTAAASGRPSALKKPGHQRAFSQGQVVDVQGHPVTVHSRVGSKTDFILPPGHRDVPRITTARTPSYRGHSRQASRSESIYTIRRSAAPPWWRRIWAYYFGSSPEQPKLRTIIPNHLVPPKTPPKQHPNGTIDNRVRTTKYTPLTFLPRNLLEQFHRVANIYFIFIVFLNWWPEINAFGKEISIIPVMFVLGVTAIKDFFEDRRRFASDRRVNNSTCRVYCSDVNQYTKTPWKDVKVGDLIHLSNNEIVPADLLLLRSSDPQGFALLDTCNLDGETNLKQRQVVRGFLDIQDTFQASKFRSVVEVDQPSTKIYRFYGAVVHPNGTRVPVTTENLLLRECLLKNTDFIEGIVVYAGRETKAMLNNGGPRYKRSRLERQMNLDIIWCVLILIVLCIVGAVGCKLWLSTFKTTTSVPFLSDFSNSNYEGILTFLTFVIILQVMIPLSLYVTMEMAKVGQVYHIGHDTELHDPETGRKAECRALNITEELGQIQYVFSDKTGTLTENKMIFRRCFVGGQDYAHLGEDVDIMACTRLKEDLLIGNARHRLQEFLIMLAICNTVVVNTQPHHDIMNSSGVIEEPQKNGVAPMRYTRISESENSTPARSSTDNNNTPILEPLSVSVENSRPKISRPRLLNVPAMPSLNIGLLKKYSPNGNRSSPDERQNTSINSETTIITPPPIYEAESPDELALVYAAKAYDVKLIKRTARSAVISLPDKSTLAFEVLHVLPFDSNRKCMSIVVKYPNTDEIVLYSKGADSTVLSSLSSYDEESISHVKIRQQLHSYGRQGLRTLVMARRSLTKIEYDTWMEKHTEAELSFENRDRKIRESYSSLESHLTLLGATGIEDKLQEGVPEAMAALIDAGIVVWVLTGDKPETAVNIAYSAKLFSPAMQLLKLQAKTKSAAESLIHNFLETIENENSGGIDNDLQNNSSHSPGNINSVDRIAHRIGSPWQRPRALVVDGKTLTFILDSRSGLTAPFLKLTQNCSSVLACRATPLQKAYIVRVVKEKLGMRTLAIGDGANDVSMIQTADVGVGVSGREGTQAVMASDFAIARFPMLARLLLLHGHWCYDRLARMILYFFYKNAMFVFLIFWYQLYCGFSGGVMIDQVYLMLYNLLFTSLPPLVIGIYDRVASSKLLLESPELYSRGRLASVYKPHSFWITMADALYQSIIVFFVNEAAYYDSVVDIWEFGTTITTSCIAVMLLHAAMEFRSWTILHVLTIIGSLMIFFGFCLLYSFACVNCMGLPGSYYVMPVAMSRHVYWLTVLLASVLAVLPRFVYKTVKNTVAPDMLQQAKLRNRMKQKVMQNNIGRNMTNGENRLVANWSRSTEHATIRY